MDAIVVQVLVHKIKFNIPLIDQSIPRDKQGKTDGGLNKAPCVCSFFFFFRNLHFTAHVFSGRMPNSF